LYYKPTKPTINELRPARRNMLKHVSKTEVATMKA
jgi:hypothetical protein